MKLKFPLHFQILLALVAGILFGIFFPHHVIYISWMGDVFIRALKMIIIPLVLSSIITGVTSIGNAENLGRLGLKTFAYYTVTSLLAILTGLFFVNVLKPGVGADLGLVKEVNNLQMLNDSFGQILIKIIPTNIFQAFAENSMLSVIFFAILFGFFITRVKDKSKKILTEFFEGLFDVMMKLTFFIIGFAPFGVFGIVARQVSESGNIIELAKSMSIYMLAVMLALGVHGIITLPLITRYIGKVNPLKHFKSVTTPLLTAWSTSSSSATLPLTMQAVEENGGVSNKISSFTLPLGATVNMNGTALYECIAAIFIAQAYGIDLSFGQQVIVVFTALLASVGAAGIPMAGLVMITVILSAVGLPLEGVGLILSVDRILDMFRTAINVWGDTCGAVIIAKSEGEKLKV
ncbi:MAG: dicarboxylate/amino acid:cation symporter [Bacteroidales bacterium]|nr:dicarboxylate/amino acid:cation symporter [Bacteroidales bacterium]MCB9000033.1 dicarboxylate/amino acid:cation symporter [Bacteroidales bacterium]MCB9013607.1 dicarboxylate/amino acid:cation symporter [Bacteroidales bacterium]